MKQEHTFGPVYDKNSKILILGSFPSVKSREINFYYGHPQNRFWKLLANIYNDEVYTSIDDKKKFLLRNNIALWDSIKSCNIKGSSDSSISDVELNDLREIIDNSNIKKIVFNGKAAYNLFKKYSDYDVADNIKVCVLPSTSPANAACSFDKLFEVWSKELKC